jgi:U1 small nuclear ribonucleoprotein C
MNARKAHNTGRNHISNVRDYFANLGTNQAQNMIDQIVHSHEGGGHAMYAAPSMRLGAGFMNPMATVPGGECGVVAWWAVGRWRDGG